MIRPLWQIDRLRELLSQQEAEAMQSQYSQPSPKVVIEKTHSETTTPASPEPATLLKPDNGERPERLKGLSVGEILTMQADNDLTPQEEEWLSYKSIPTDNSMRMPCLKALMRRAQRKSENT